MTTEIERELIFATYKALGRRATSDDLTRPVFVTPYKGHYGVLGHLITIQGSPIRGTIIVPPDLGIDGSIREVVLYSPGRVMRCYDHGREYEKRHAAVVWAVSDLLKERQVKRYADEDETDA